MSTFRPDMTFSWASPQMTSPRQPQNRTLPTWGAIGTPANPHVTYNPSSPLAMARKAVGMSGLGGLGAYGDEPMTVYGTAFRLAGLASSVGLVYHGYKRNNGSVGWALVWGLLGGIVWPITLPIAYAQGFGKPKKR